VSNHPPRRSAKSKSANSSEYLGHRFILSTSASESGRRVILLGLVMMSWWICFRRFSARRQ